MKYLLLVVAVFVLLWLLRGARNRRMPPPERRADARAAPPLPMVSCAQCGMHLPQHDALPGRGGVFCGEAHRAEYEREHP
jgi:uncharacterized protein